MAKNTYKYSVRLGAKYFKGTVSANSRGEAGEIIARQMKVMPDDVFISGDEKVRTESFDDKDYVKAVIEHTLFQTLRIIKAAGQAKYVNGYVSFLGGPQRGSLLLTISLDAKESWPNGILENSRYAKFHINWDGAMELISGHGMAKFRKTNIGFEGGPVVTAENIADSIKKWLTASLAMQVTRTEAYVAQISKDAATLK
jgi:hypothetical protein